MQIHVAMVMVKGLSRRSCSGIGFLCPQAARHLLQVAFLRRHSLLSTSLRLPTLKMFCMWKIFPKEFTITDFLSQENFSEMTLELCPRGRF